MGWDGDISRMGQLAERVADLGAVPSRAAARIATEIEHLIDEEFEYGADPYGSAWTPLTDTTLAKRHGDGPPLTDFGNMRRSLHVAPLARAGVGITIDHPAAPHQTGWSGRQGSGPPRPILPAREMPPLWGEAIEAAVEQAFRRSA
jgi:hypothetical protein